MQCAIVGKRAAGCAAYSQGWFSNNLVFKHHRQLIKWVISILVKKYKQWEIVTPVNSFGLIGNENGNSASNCRNN